MSRKSVILILIFMLLLSGCSKSVSYSEKYIQMCNNNQFSQEDLRDCILNLDKFDWKKLYQNEVDNPKYISLFWKLEEYETYDEDCIKSVLLLHKGHGLDGGISEEYMGLVEYLYKNPKYSEVIEKLRKENKTINETIEAYIMNYEIPQNY